MIRTIKAFTLAEVLITLVIIGVIASMTVPNLIMRTKQEQYITGCKKIYSTLAQAVLLAEKDYGSMKTWELEDTGEGKNTAFVKQYILPYLITAKDCGTTFQDNCPFQYKALNAQNHSYWANGWHKIILNDGSTAIFNHGEENQNSEWMIVTIDVNGDRKPNVISKDIFTFVYWIQTPNKPRWGKFEPYGVDWPRESLISNEGGNACNKQSTGELCAALIVKDSWQMLDDYPI